MVKTNSWKYNIDTFQLKRKISFSTIKITLTPTISTTANENPDEENQDPLCNEGIKQVF